MDFRTRPSINGHPIPGDLFPWGTGRFRTGQQDGLTIQPANGILFLALVTMPNLNVLIDQLSVQFTVAGTAGTALARLGLYDDDGTGRPGPLLVDAGTVAADAVALRSINLGAAVGPSSMVVWTACVTQGNPAGTPAYRRGSGSHPAMSFDTAAQATTSSSNAHAWTVPGVVGALPASVAGLLVGPQNTYPLVVMRRA